MSVENGRGRTFQFGLIPRILYDTRCLFFHSVIGFCFCVIYIIVNVSFIIGVVNVYLVTQEMWLKLTSIVVIIGLSVVIYVFFLRPYYKRSYSYYDVPTMIIIEEDIIHLGVGRKRYYSFRNSDLQNIEFVNGWEVFNYLGPFSEAVKVTLKGKLGIKERQFFILPYISNYEDLVHLLTSKLKKNIKEISDKDTINTFSVSGSYGTFIPAFFFLGIVIGCFFIGDTLLEQFISPENSTLYEIIVDPIVGIFALIIMPFIALRIPLKIRFTEKDTHLIFMFGRKRVLRNYEFFLRKSRRQVQLFGVSPAGHIIIDGRASYPISSECFSRYSVLVQQLSERANMLPTID